MKLYVYDHCPYCVKARMIFGLKNVAFELVTLLNDDEQTPISMIGAKMVPVLTKEDGSHMPESMDIIHWVDENFGGEKVIKPGQPGGHPLTELSSVVYVLAMPRWVKIGLEEFATDDAIAYFTRKKEAMIGSFEENLAKSAEYIAQAEEILNRLDDTVKSPDGVNGELSEDDIHVFAHLRSLSCVKGIKYPPKIDAYRKRMAELCGIQLHDDIAI